LSSFLAAFCGATFFAGTFVAAAFFVTVFLAATFFVAVFLAVLAGAFFLGALEASDLESWGMSKIDG